MLLQRSNHTLQSNSTLKYNQHIEQLPLSLELFVLEHLRATEDEAALTECGSRTRST